MLARQWDNELDFVLEARTGTALAPVLVSWLELRLEKVLVISLEDL